MKREKNLTAKPKKKKLEGRREENKKKTGEGTTGPTAKRRKAWREKKRKGRLLQGKRRIS